MTPEFITNSESYNELNENDKLIVDELIAAANKGNVYATKRLLRTAIVELDYRGQLSL